MPNLGNRQLGKRNLLSNTRKAGLGNRQQGKRNLLKGMAPWELNNVNYSQSPEELSNGTMAYWHKNGTLHGGRKSRKNRKSRKSRRN